MMPASQTDFQRYLARMPSHSLIGRCIPVGETSHDHFPLLLSQGALNTHQAIFGRTGTGKSKYLEHFIRCLIAYGIGLAYIDPHGDTAEDILAFIDAQPEPHRSLIMKKVLYLEPSHDDWTFSIDQFSRGCTSSGTGAGWLESKAESSMLAIIRKQGEYDTAGKPLLELWMKIVLHAVGTDVDGKGTHLSLADAFLLLSPDDPRFDSVFSRIAPHLPEHYLSEYQELIRYPRDRSAKIGSTKRRLSSFLSERVQLMFSHQAPPLDFRGFFRAGGILLVNLKKNENTGFTRTQSDAIGGLIINELRSIAADLAEHERGQPFHVIIDEAPRYTGADLIQSFGEARKWRMPFTVAAQRPSSLRNSELDMAEAVIGECGVKVTFQIDNPDDIELLARTYKYKDLDHTRDIVEVNLNRGYRIITTQSGSSSHTRGTGSDTTTGTDRSRQHTAGHSRPTPNPNHTGTISNADGEGTTQKESHRTSNSENFTEQQGWKETVVADVRVEERDQGLKYPYRDQFPRMGGDIATQAQRECIISVGHRPPFYVTTPFVHPPRPVAIDPEARALLNEGFKRTLWEIHPCFFRTVSACLDANERIQRFLSASAAPIANITAVPQPIPASELFPAEKHPSNPFGI